MLWTAPTLRDQNSNSFARVMRFPAVQRPPAAVSCVILSVGSTGDIGISPSQQAKRAIARRPSRLGVLPEWNLADLYSGLDDPQVKRDLERGAAESLAFEQAYKGKLAALVERSEAGSALVAAVERYEALDGPLGRRTA